MNLDNNSPATKMDTDEISVEDTKSDIAVQVPNSVLQRLIEEVKYETENNVSAYNRLHNRHNRTR